MTNKQISAKVFTAIAVVTTIGISAMPMFKAVSQPLTPISTLTAQAPANTWQNVRPIRTIEAHSGSVGAIAISANGQLIASGSDDGTIKVWNLKTGQLIRALTGHTDTIWALAISPNGQTLASSSATNDGSLKLWNLKTGKVIRTIKQDWYVKSLAFSPDGERLAIGSWNTTARNAEIEVWNARTGKLIYSFQGSPQSNLMVAFSPDGKTLASGNEDSTIQLWDVRAGKPIRTLNNGEAVRAIAFGRDSKTLVSESYNQIVKIWNLQTGELISTPIKDSGIVFVNAVALHPNGRILASALGGSEGTLNLFNLQTGNAINPLTGSFSVVSSLAFTPNGQTLVSGNFDGTITFWEPQ